MRSVSAAERRALLVRRHHLDGGATGPDEVAASLVGLHATEAASVHLAVLARSRSATPADIDDALHHRRSLVRWLGMRRTLFVLPRDTVPVVQAAAGRPVAELLRRQLVRTLDLNGSEPALDAAPADWLDAVGEQVVATLDRLGPSTGRQLGDELPALRTTIPPRTASERRRTVTSSLLTLLGADARIVRGAAVGDWTTRRFRWEPVTGLWPDGVPELDPVMAQRDLVRSYLTAYGPVRETDIAWWTGWGIRVVRSALAALPVEEVDLEGAAGVALDDGSLDRDLALGTPDPVATLLPTLDCTPMGWQERSWFLDVDPGQLFDRAGNIGPTVWWDGRVVGGWAVARSGEVRTAVLADCGREARDAVGRAADTLQHRLAGAVVTTTLGGSITRTLSRDDG